MARMHSSKRMPAPEDDELELDIEESGGAVAAGPPTSHTTSAAGAKSASVAKTSAVSEEVEIEHDWDD